MFSFTYESKLKQPENRNRLTDRQKKGVSKGERGGVGEVGKGLRDNHETDSYKRMSCRDVIYSTGNRVNIL